MKSFNIHSIGLFLPDNKRLLRVVLFFTLLLGLLPSLVRLTLSQFTLAGLLSDIVVGFVVTLASLSLPRYLRPLVIFLWAAILTGSFSLLDAIARLPSWSDYTFITDNEFIVNSLTGGGYLFGLHLLLFGFSGGLLVLPARVCLGWLKLGLAFALLLLVTLLHSLSINVARQGANLSAQYNPVHWLVVEAINYLRPTGVLSADTMVLQDLSGERLIDSGKAKNVLLIILEGIPGLYLEQARKHFDINASEIQMPRLSKLAKNGMITPDFIVHGHQTIRGLYAILCADYNKLSWTTPKAYQLQNSPERAVQCLPAQLKKMGFATHYLQGAGLEFMSKDTIMPIMGFDKVYGREWFQKKKKGRKIPGWGVDDRAFFKGTLQYIDEIKKEKSPWFLTLLTVGTHQPYNPPADCLKRFSDRGHAAIACLDDSLDTFFKSLKKSGVLANTLVIVTSDESHGAALADWVSSWGLNIVFAPEGATLPKINKGTYGVIDTTVSILDYFGGEINPALSGRSLFRSYTKPREMVSYTAGRLRWLDKSGKRSECSDMGTSNLCTSKSLIGFADCQETNGASCGILAKKAAWLDQSISRFLKTQTLRFIGSARRIKITPWKDQWTDSLIGAQYLNFPAGSRTTVTLRWRAIKTEKQGARLKMFLKEREADSDAVAPDIPALKAGEESEFTFEIQNKKARSSFSFHLLSESTAEIEILDFVVTTVRESW
ncbi:MAG: LTA synthase family protein [Deltaproteobacteria bacterium]|nr:LTA synthase family protein [Deltaproteobacteria bacterium]